MNLDILDIVDELWRKCSTTLLWAKLKTWKGRKAMAKNVLSEFWVFDGEISGATGFLKERTSLSFW